MRHLLLASLLVTMGVCAARAGDSDWFSASGFTVMEAVGQPQMGYALVGEDETGVYKILTAGDSFKGKFTVKAIGSEQVKVIDSDGNAKVALILHQNLPVDLMLAAVGSIYQRGVVIAGTSAQPVSSTPDMVTSPDRLVEVCKAQGLDLKVRPDFLVAGKAALPATIVVPKASDTEPSVSIDLVRAPMAQVLSALAAKGWTVKAGGPLPDVPMTVRAKDVPLSTIVAYVQAASGVSVAAVPPPAPAAVAPIAAPAHALTPIDPVTERRLYLEAKSLYKQGKIKDSFQRVRTLLHASRRAPYYDLLGAIYHRAHKDPLAIKAWRKALSLSPGDTFARHAMVVVGASAARI